MNFVGFRPNLMIKTGSETQFNGYLTVVKSKTHTLAWLKCETRLKSTEINFADGWR
jgi:hypothetical protein